MAKGVASDTYRDGGTRAAFDPRPQELRSCNVMSTARRIIDWLRRPAADADPETTAEAQRLQDDRETIRGSQSLTSGMTGPGLSNVTPTPDVLHPERER